MTLIFALQKKPRHTGESPQLLIEVYSICVRSDRGPFSPALKMRTHEPQIKPAELYT